MAVSCRVSKSNILLETQWLEVLCWFRRAPTKMRRLICIFLFLVKETSVYSIGYSNTKNTKTQIWRSNKHSNESSVSWLSTPSNKSSILDTPGENSNIIIIDHHGMEQRNYFGAPVFPQSTISYRNNIGPKTTATNSTQSLQALQAVHWRQVLRSAARHISNCSTATLVQMNLQNTGSG